MSLMKIIISFTGLKGNVMVTCMQRKIKIDEINIQLTYYNIESEETRKFIKYYTFKELEEFFLGLIEEYVEWANMTFYWQMVRDAAIKELSFPFKNYRKGQRKLAVAVYETILNEKKPFCSGSNRYW